VLTKVKAMFSKTCKYAIKATIYIAQNADNTCVRVSEIAKSINAPEPFTAKILQALSKNKIISSVKGPNGGFCMNENQLKQPIYEVVRCIDGSDVLTACVLGLEVCSSKNPCPMHFEYEKIKLSIKKMLENNTISHFSNLIATEKAVFI
jgi:Rrf2 family iron-sulfur cluster assembly transcriptional regulator